MVSDEDREDRLRSWALTDLTYYGPEEGGHGSPQWGMRGGIVTSEGISVEAQGSVAYRGPGTDWIEVESRRPADDEFVEVRDRAAMQLYCTAQRDDAESTVDQEIRWTQEARSAIPPEWMAVVIAVTGRPTIFCFSRLGEFWTAAGRAIDADLVVRGRGDSIPTSLIPIPGPGPVHFRPPMSRAPRARRFPDDLLAPVVPGDIADDARVDLVYRPGELSGTYAGEPVRLALDVPSDQSSVTGNFTGADLSAGWDLTSNVTAHPDVPGTLNGTFAGQAVSLAGTFHLDDDFGIEHADINGDINGEAITGHLEAVDGGIDDSSGAVRIEGDFAGTAFALYTTISADLTVGKIRGVVAGEVIRLDTATTTTGDHQTESVRIVGCYAGPAALLAIVVCTFLYFV